MLDARQKITRTILLPNAPVLVQNGRHILCLHTDGRLEKLKIEQAAALVRQDMPIVCHAPQMARLLGLERLAAYDVLELFAFVHPGRFCVPSPAGLARALFLLEPDKLEDEAAALRSVMRHLITDLTDPAREERGNPAAVAAFMAGNDGLGWPWAETILHALDRHAQRPEKGEIRAALKIWERLPEWAQHAAEPPLGHFGVSADESAERLEKILLRQSRKPRGAQDDYARQITAAFAPRQNENDTRLFVAEAGTGIGKTLGYLAPATVWAEKNAGAVWVSTFTRTLQRQIDQELEHLYDDPVLKTRKVVTRKGRENYLCLLNLEEAIESPAAQNNPQTATALGLMARWAGATADGDLTGRDFPGWLAGIFGWNKVYGLADRRGECIYTACPHFNKCFIEKSVRKSKRADIVIANHALVMHQTALASTEDDMPTRYVFDEGHHIFDAADSIFASHLNGQETADLRRWILGQEGGQKSRARGLKRRVEELIAQDADAQRDLDDILDAARSLPGPEWRARLNDGSPKGVAENFLHLCRQQVYARAEDKHSPYAIECDVWPPVDGLVEAAYALRLRLMDLRRPMLALAAKLQNKLNDETEDLNTDARERIRYVIQNLKRKADHTLAGWTTLLESLSDPKTSVANSNGTVDWLEVTRGAATTKDGARDDDAGFYSHAVDPTVPFAQALKPHAHGVLVTSATLRDVSEQDPDGWQSPLRRIGAQALSEENGQGVFPSPFDYKNKTRVLVVGDVGKETPAETAGAMASLFTAAGGGGLGIFTAIQRLKAVYPALHKKLGAAGLGLYAQHVDTLDMGTLLELFKAEENASLIGTDATRDGIDVPGRSLRLVVYDRVPWPRPTILHRARKQHFGKGYEDMLTRFKLKQAYGRLIRTSEDRGVFVMLDSRLPTRLTTAFPEGIAIERVGIADAVKIVAEFFKTSTAV
jgi:ATP-dependent DNA helicase DinG